MSIEEIRTERVRERRISAHSHIRGLGLDERGKAKKIADGLVGQEEAREAAGIVVRIVKEGKFSGRGILLAGPPGTGKTAIAIAIARELGEDTPFVALNAAEIYSLERKKTEVLMQAIRQAIGVRIKEKRTVYEGVVTEFRPRVRRARGLAYGFMSFGSSELVLETRDESLRLNVGPEITEQLVSLNVRVGDVIMIDAETGAVRKLGKAREKAKRVYDIEVSREVPIPSGPVKKVKEVVRMVTLNDIDIYFSAERTAFFGGILGIFAVEREISDEVRKKTDETVKQWIESGKAELVPGVLFIDDAHLLDLEAFSFLTKAMESEFAPIIVLATNRGITKIRGTDIEAPHGIPRDLLDRLLIIPTRPYTLDEIKAIITIRADEEDVPLSEDAIDKLAEIGSKRSLRYALQLMEPAKIIAEREGRTKVTAKDVEEASKLFTDVKSSLELVEKYKDLMLT